MMKEQISRLFGLGDRANQDEVKQIPVDEIDPTLQIRFATDTQDAMFARLRKERPVQFLRQSQYGPLWNVTRYKDIVDVDALSGRGMEYNNETRHFTLHAEVRGRFEPGPAPQ